MIYTPQHPTERLAIASALRIGCLYHTYGLGRQRMYYRVIRELPDGTYEVELADPPSQQPGPSR